MLTKQKKKKKRPPGSSVLMVVSIAMWIQPDKFVPGIVYTICFFSGAGVAAAFLIPWSMVPDVIDVDEVR
jgi:GPH family glycoside/pentoside/hexuronide:cation symporter